LKNDRRQKLMDLGAQNLVDALPGLAELSGAADDLVERLIATSKEKEKRCSPESETRVGVLCLGILKKSRPSGWMPAFLNFLNPGKKVGKLASMMFLRTI